MANAPVLVAEQKHYFQKNGLNVHLQAFSSGPLLKRALEAGDLDVAYIGMPPVYHANAEGLNLRIIAKVNFGQASLIVRKNSTIHSLRDLRNRKIADVRSGSGMDILLRGFILTELARLDPITDVKLVHMRTNMMGASIQHGVVDAAFTWEPYVSQSVLLGHARVLLDVNKAIPGYPWYVVAATRQARNNRRGDLKKLLRAHQQAITYLNSSKTAASKIISQAFELEKIVSLAGPPLTSEAIIKEARTRLGWQAEFSPSDKRFLQRLIEYSYTLGMIPAPRTADDLLDNSLLLKPH